MRLLPWDTALRVIACTFHGVAIASTVFRLIYRWYIASFWWDDGWALVALLATILPLVSALIEVPLTVQGIPPIDNTALWMASVAFPCILWACRTSILLSIVRVANPSQWLRRVVFLSGVSFLVMWAGLMAQRIQICAAGGCHTIATSVGIAQIITDVISDLILVSLPVCFLWNTKIDQKQRIMIFSVFSASLLITVVTLLHSAVLIMVESDRDGIIVVAHVKTALSLIVCNLLVIVAFVYRMFRCGNPDTADGAISFTSVDPNVYPMTMSTIGKCTMTIERHSMASETSNLTTPGIMEAGGVEGCVGSESA